MDLRPVHRCYQVVLGHPLASLLLPDCGGLELFQVHFNQAEIHVVLQHQLPQLRTLDGSFALALFEISRLSQNNHDTSSGNTFPLGIVLNISNIGMVYLWYWDGFVCGM